MVRKEPRFHEEAKEWWLPQVETDLQVAINAAVMVIGVAEIPQVGSPGGDPETTLLELIPCMRIWTVLITTRLMRVFL